MMISEYGEHLGFLARRGRGGESAMQASGGKVRVARQVAKHGNVSSIEIGQFGVAVISFGESGKADGCILPVEAPEAERFSKSRSAGLKAS